MDCSIYVAKTKALISCAVTEKFEKENGSYRGLRRLIKPHQVTLLHMAKRAKRATTKKENSYLLYRLSGIFK